METYFLACLHVVGISQRFNLIAVVAMQKKHFPAHESTAAFFLKFDIRYGEGEASSREGCMHGRDARRKATACSCFSKVPFAQSSLLLFLQTVILSQINPSDLDTL